MSAPRAHLQLPDGTGVELYPGAILGRSSQAHAQVLDPRVSEVHACISLRSDRLMLLALRQRVWLDDTPQDEIVLRTGMVIELVPGLPVRVREVVLPDTVLAISWRTPRGEGLQRLTWQLLESGGSVVSRPLGLVAGPPRQDALATFWADGDLVWIRWEGADPVVLTPGASWVVSGVLFSVLELPLTGTAATQAVDGGLHLDLHDTFATLTPRTGEALHLTKAAAALLWELADFPLNEPVPWRVLAALVWPTLGSDGPRLRKRLDDTLYRLRQKLRKTGQRDDVVVATSGGEVVLRLNPGDEVVRHP